MTDIVGISKGGHHSSICLIRGSRGDSGIEIILKERVNRVKAAGGSIVDLLIRFAPELGGKAGRKLPLVAETSSFLRPSQRDYVQERYLSHSMLETFGLTTFSARFNPALRFVSHHQAHAMAAVEFSPFKHSLIVVLDGAGSSPEAFDPDDPEIAGFYADQRRPPGTKYVAESCTVYLQDEARLRCVRKDWQNFIRTDSRLLSAGLGMFYETAAVYLFGSKNAAGKVMGLAAYGHPRKVRDRLQFWREVDWNRAFRGRGKEAWERGDFQFRANIAATVQDHYERSLYAFIRDLKTRHPNRENLILTGGCALNCVANQKIADSGLFKSVYVPAAPGDESVSLGAASWLRYHELGRKWVPRRASRQVPYFGQKSSEPSVRTTRATFKEHIILKPISIADEVAKLLAQGKLVGWFQGRSESGPRALGHRSLLANPMVPGIRDYLNSKIKQREAFRPYGASCPAERAEEYFSLPRGMESPFMSFAPKVRRKYSGKLTEITHRDGTSRIQTVRREQNPLFHRLLIDFGKRTGIPCVLNTSLNGKEEPIVETVQDASRFFEKVPIDAIAVGDLLILRKPKKPRQARSARR